MYCDGCNSLYLWRSLEHIVSSEGLNQPIKTECIGRRSEMKKSVLTNGENQERLYWPMERIGTEHLVQGKNHARVSKTSERIYTEKEDRGSICVDTNS